MVGLPVRAASPASPVSSLEGARGLVLAGGDDIGDSPKRDNLELALLEQAWERDLPVFGICRGMQFLNHFRGGCLHKDIPGHKIPGVVVRHDVAVRPGSRLHALVGGAVNTNSRHHQAVDLPGQDVIITANAPDGVAEGLEVSGKNWVLGVQWHPEDLAAREPPHLRLFEAFRDAVLCSGRASSPRL
jgi:putative glutamine amidotransferase